VGSNWSEALRGPPDSGPKEPEVIDLISDHSDSLKKLIDEMFSSYENEFDC
jgi:hypothetical protein